MLAFLEKKNGVIKCNIIIFYFPLQKLVYKKKVRTSLLLINTIAIVYYAYDKAYGRGNCQNKRSSCLMLFINLEPRK
jgi:hypothetical protein